MRTKTSVRTEPVKVEPVQHGISMPDTKEIDSKAMLALEAARALIIKTEPQYVEASEFLKDLKLLEKTIEETFDPIVKATHAAWKSALSAKDKHLVPIKEAEGIIKDKLIEYQDAAEKARREEEARLREEAKKNEEKELVERAQALIDAGRPEEALKILGEEPPPPPPVIVPPSVPKVKGIVTKEVWKFEIVNLGLLPREYMLPDEKKIRAVVQAMGESTNIPGVRVWKASAISVDSKK